MPDKDRHAGNIGGHFNRGVKDALGLCHHFPLFISGAVFHNIADLRDHIKGDLFGKRVGLDRVIDVDTPRLVEQLVHRRFPRTRNRLVGRNYHPLYLRRVVQRLERYHHLYGRAVWVGDDILAPVLAKVVGERLAVHFGNNKRAVGVVAKLRGVVDDQSALLPGARRKGF